MTKSLTNLTPSGVERIRAEALEAIIVKYEAGNNHDERHFNSDCQTCLIMRDLRALALPSEPPSQGDVEP